MERMFSCAYSFNQPLSNWDVSNVINMESMFYSAHRFNQPLNNWDVSNVTNMSGMFYEAKSFNQPIDNWDVSNVTNMKSMFYNAESFNQDISTWIINDYCKIISEGFYCKMFDRSVIKRENFENKNYCSKIALSFTPPLPNPKTNEELENIKIEKIKSNIRIFEENKNLPKLCEDVEIVIKDF